MQWHYIGSQIGESGVKKRKEPSENHSDALGGAGTPPGDGRLALLAAGEKLFAEYGLHGASLRQIGEAAGQKNASAIQYHFGSRDQLVEAVFDLRMAAVNPRRQAMLDDLRRDNRQGEVRAIIAAMVWPVAEELRPRAEGNHYLRFLSRASHETLLSITFSRPDLTSAGVEAVRMLREALRYLPEQIARTRVMLAADQVVAGLAVFESQALGAADDFEMRVETLIDMIAAAVAAPISTQTLQAVESQKISE